MSLKPLIFFLLLLTTVTAEKQNVPDRFKNKPNRYNPMYPIIYVSFALFVSLFIRALINAYELPISCMAIIFTAGVLLELLTLAIPSLSPYAEVIYHINPYTLLSIILPILVFKIAFCLDAHTFVRAWFQIFLISLPGLLLTTVFVGLMAIVVLGERNNWSICMAMLFGIIGTPIYPADVVEMLNSIGRSKQLIILLEGEAMIGVGCAVTVFTLLMGYEEGYLVTWYHFVMVFGRIFGGGLLFGYILGKVTCWVVSALYNDMISMMLMTLSSCCISFYIFETYFNISGVICVAVMGTMLSKERASLSQEVEQFLVFNWELLTYTTNAITYMSFGVLSVGICANYGSYTDIAFIVITYTLVSAGRVISFVVLSPVLSRISYGLTFRHLAILACTGLKGCVTMSLAYIVFCHPLFARMKKDVAIQMIGLVLMSLIINVSLSPILLKLMGMYDLSLARKANMNNSVKYVLNRRMKTIAVLKMDRFLMDANWATVYEVTTIKHPYKLKLTETDSDDDFLMTSRYTTCPDCLTDIPQEPTIKELTEMAHEARMRVLKANKISFSRQYENGMITKDGFRVLTVAVEYAMDTQAAVIELDGLHKLFKREGRPKFLENRMAVIFSLKNDYDCIRPPKNYWRRKAYHVVRSKYFDPIIYTIIVLNLIPILCELIYPPLPNSSYENILIILEVLFFLCYLIEFILKIAAYSYIYICRHGFYTYFNSYWNVFDFVILMACITSLILTALDIFSPYYNKYDSKFNKLLLIAGILRILKLFRLFRLCKAFYPKIIKQIDNKLGSRKAFAYDIGKGFVTAQDEVTIQLNQMIDNEKIREEIKTQIEADKLAVTKQLGLVQRDRPWIAITVKTKQAIMSVLNSMRDALYELKVSGLVDDLEYQKLMRSLNVRFKYVRTIKMVQPSSPKVMFQEVPWMAEDDHIIDFLYQRVKILLFEEDDVICSEGQMSEGVYILVAGIFKLIYNPDETVIERLTTYGELPVIDCLNALNFDQKLKDYIVSGNSIGELSHLTGRPYNCKIVADTSCHVYLLTHNVLKEAMAISNDPTEGLASRMWKCVSSRLATTILMNVPAYISEKQEVIRFTLQRSFIPDLTQYRALVVNDMMEDIILIDGAVIDYNTTDQYLAPTYIPRTVQKIMLMRGDADLQEKRVEPKLLIIPVEDVESYEIMEIGAETSELKSTVSLKCIQHTVQHKSVLRRRMKKPRSMGASSMSAQRSVLFSTGSGSYSDEVLSYAYDTVSAEVSKNISFGSKSVLGTKTSKKDKN